MQLSCQNHQCVHANTSSSGRIQMHTGIAHAPHTHTRTHTVNMRWGRIYLSLTCSLSVSFSLSALSRHLAPSFIRGCFRFRCFSYTWYSSLLGDDLVFPQLPQWWTPSRWDLCVELSLSLLLYLFVLFSARILSVAWKQPRCFCISCTTYVLISTMFWWLFDYFLLSMSLCSHPGHSSTFRYHILQSDTLDMPKPYRVR